MRFLKYMLCFGIILDLDVSMYFCLDDCKDDCQIKTYLLVCVLKSVGETISSFWAGKEVSYRFKKCWHKWYFFSCLSSTFSIWME